MFERWRHRARASKAWCFALLTVVALSVAGCSNGPPAAQTPVYLNDWLSVVFPLETTELIGGESLRVTALLVDQDGQPVEEAAVEAELFAPSGDLFVTLSCADTGQGRYLADYVDLPTRGSEGAWRVVVQAAWDDVKRARAERTFHGLPSPSDEYQGLYGFWVEAPDFFDCHGTDQWFATEQYEDGSGYVSMENHCHGTGSSSARLVVWWEEAGLPANEAAASAYVLTPRTSFQYNHDDPDENLVVKQATFQDRPVWWATGRWASVISDPAVAGPLAGGPVEWMIFQCPDSNWLWTLVILTNSEPYMNGLRTLRGTFECPTSSK